ncbi:alpha/beta fold hydrolase [Paratissierella segnis]|jgi:pimeloyl-ACP methyl ester carboxylesterase|uniref:Alpha/beta hydrolase n=1 Tax=Paratissierella segnis TaxID=2763679 RepID=A0A926EXP5_9FIRM|nr:alpha/beta hydrolase [Paratissierella segnis]MBC8589491.1 alpha/beta hydrolase [Paratissierella segnis]
MFIDIEGLALNYIVEGEGSPAVILHGWGCHIETVMSIVNILKERYKVYCIDLPGFGKSDKPKDVLGSFDYARIVKKFLESMDVKKAVFIGHSFGGKLSIIFGSKYPECVEKIVLIDSAGLIPKRGIKYYFKVYSFKTLRFIYKHLFFWIKDDKRMEKFYKKFGSDDYKNSDGIMRRILVKVVNEDLKPILKDIKVPTLLIWGDKDDATPLYMAKIMEKEIEDSGLVILEGTGHYSYLEDYSKFTAVIKSFLF